MGMARLLVMVWGFTGLAMMLLTGVASKPSSIGRLVCYSCSSLSSLCRDRVYDGQYLSVTSCSSACFIKREHNVTYRGCFDGWLGGQVTHNYTGCQVQQYRGKRVEWCFCRNPDSNDLANTRNDVIRSTENYEPCNAASVQKLRQLSQLDTGHEDIQFHNHASHELRPEESLDQTAFVQDMSTYAREGKSRADEDEPITLRDPRGLRYEAGDDKDLVWCLVCHDDVPHCGHHVTDMTHIDSIPCTSHCFVRQEAGKLFRGCFDGWLSTHIARDSTGCKYHDHKGDRVTWCFCASSRCNAASMGDLAEGRSVSVEFPLVRQRLSAGPIGYQAKDGEPRPQYKAAPLEKLWRESACTNTDDGLYADPVSCTFYVHCVRGYTFRRQCPPGTGWNPRLNTCDFDTNLPYVCDDIHIRLHGNDGRVQEVTSHSVDARVRYDSDDVEQQSRTRSASRKFETGHHTDDIKPRDQSKPYQSLRESLQSESDYEPIHFLESIHKTDTYSRNARPRNLVHDAFKSRNEKVIRGRHIDVTDREFVHQPHPSGSFPQVLTAYSIDGADDSRIQH